MTGDEAGPEGSGPGPAVEDADDGGGTDGPTGDPAVGPPDPRDGPAATLRWFLETDDEFVVFTREFARSALVVLLVGLLLFGVSGVWPPMVAVESPSMTPHMQPGDLVFLMEENRLVPATAEAGTGVATYHAVEDAGTGYQRFGDSGDVIVYTTPERSARGDPPIIHRAHVWVERGDNWYREVNPEYVRADSCEDVRYCPAPHDGFITKGDANPYYDQSQGLSPPVRPSWIRGTAELRVPWLGCVRLYYEALTTGVDATPPACKL